VPAVQLEDRIGSSNGQFRLAFTSSISASVTLEMSVADSGGHIHPVHFLQVPFNLARRHSARIHGNDFVVEAGEPSLILGDDLRLEASIPVPRRVQADLPEITFQVLFASTVARVTLLFPTGSCFS
jgi:hypothetical protein